MKLAIGWRKLNIKTLAGIIIIVIVAGAILAWHPWHKSPSVSGAGGPPTYSQLADTRTATANAEAAQGKYVAAEQDFIAAAGAALGNQAPKKAITILEQAENAIGKNNTTWRLYDTLVGAARIAGDKQLEISSLKTTLQKAQLPNSGAPAAYITIYKSMLKSLGAG